MTTLLDLYNAIGKALEHMDSNMPIVRAAGGDSSGYYDVIGELEIIDLVPNYNAHKTYAGPHEDVDGVAFTQITDKEHEAMDDMSGEEIDKLFESIKSTRVPKSIKALVFR